MILPGGKYSLGQSAIEDALRMEPGSEAAQLFNKMRELEIADIRQDESGKWRFKMLNTGWLVTGGLGALLIVNKIRR